MLDRSDDRGILLIAAAPAESRAVCAAFGQAPPERDWSVIDLAPGWAMVQSGVGKVNAAICAAKCAEPARPARFRTVINLGVCGALPAAEGKTPPGIGAVVLADSSIYADEGIATETGFTDIAAAGFPPGGKVDPDFAGCSIDTHPALLEALIERLPDAMPDHVGPIATVSTCSGTDALALAIAQRTGAIAEAMEGAAIAHALARLHGGAVRFAEVRVVSNTTGDRAKQVWDLKGALARLQQVVAALSAR